MGTLTLREEFAGESIVNPPIRDISRRHRSMWAPTVQQWTIIEQRISDFTEQNQPYSSNDGSGLNEKFNQTAVIQIRMCAVVDKLKTSLANFSLLLI